MDRILAASVVIRDDLDRVLLVLRGREPAKGRWSVPGGKVEPGESLTEAAVREAYEETGLCVEIGARLWVVDIPAGEGRVFEVHDFAATVVGGEVTPGDDADDARWFGGDEIDRVPLTDGLRGYLVGIGVVPPDAPGPDQIDADRNLG